MDFGPYTVLVDFALMSALLFIAQILRARMRWLQDLYLPAAIIAGFLGFFLGDSFLSHAVPGLADYAVPFSSEASAYPYLLVVVLFASLYIGNSKQQSLRSMLRQVGDTFSINLAAELGGFGMALLVGGLLLIVLVPDVHSSFALLQPAGFIGGHGYAAAIGTTLEEAPQTFWRTTEAVAVGQTFATVGILSGILGGLAVINIGARRRYTRLTRSVASLPADMRSGFVDRGDQKPLGRATVNPMTLDPLAWHGLLVLIAAGGGYFLYHWMRDLFPAVVLPMMCLSMLCGVALQKLLNLFRMQDTVDKRVITRLGSTVTDYLVAFGIASIKVSVVVEFAVPLLILSLVGISYALFFLFVIAKRVFRNYWFERGVFVFGWTTGVVAMGVTLLRIVDPDFRSKTLDDYGMAYVFISMIELIVISVLPSFVALGFASNNHWFTLAPGIALLLVSLALIVNAVRYYGIQSKDGTAPRADEFNIHIDE